jgi:thioredoxin
MATQIFLSYRREDSAGYTGRIQDRIRRDLGNVLFVDVDAVPLGVNFVKYLHEEVARCAALLAVIGSRWLDARDDDGKRRVDNPNDFVRVEIGAALQRNIPVIPILVDGVKIPRANQLPKVLKELAVRNALDVRHASFHSDMDKLITYLKRQLALADKQDAQQPMPRHFPIGRALNKPFLVPFLVVKDSTTETFDKDVLEESKNQPVLVDFWAEWSQPCKRLAFVLEKVVRAANGKVKLVRLDIDKHPSIPAKFGIQSIPNVLAFINGQLADGFLGELTEKQVSAFIERVTKRQP